MIAGRFFGRGWRRAAVGAAVLSLLSVGAWAEGIPKCASHMEMATALEREYGEKLAGIGMVSEDVILEMFASEDYETWTIVATTKDHQSCIVASGRGWIGHPKGTRL